jgi:serine/threonine protein kinase/ABC-type sugar transport system substrate-binding protein
MPDSMIGRKIDDFVIEEPLGHGAMAEVYKAFQSSISRYVALKIIRLDEGQGQHEEFRRRFAHEAEVIAHLEHIHILPIYAYGINDQIAYLAMRWLKGGTLSQLMRREKLTLEKAADIFSQIAKGLAYAHSQGVIHRDLKPSNIMLDDTGNAYLTDFGLAKLVEATGEITKTGNIVGTPAYMSPEQLRGEPLDYRCDIYSLGVILYNMIVGRLPFDTTTSDLVSVIYQHLEKPPIPPREVNPNIPPAVEAVILKALQKDRNDRFASALDMSRALNEALGRPSSPDTQTEIPAPMMITHESLAAKSQRWFGVGYPTLAVILVLLLVVSFLVFQSVKTNQELAAQQTADSAASIALAATSTAASWTPTPLPVATVLAGESWTSDKIVPTAAQVAQARNRIGSNFIAFIACNQTSQFHAALAREIRARVTAYNLPYRIYDSDNDDGNQVPLIERARSEGAVGIMLCPLTEDLIRDSLTSIQQAHFPLVLYPLLKSNYGGVQVGGDNYQLGLVPGEFAGMYIRDKMGGKADVVVMDYPSLDYLMVRANGLIDGVRKFAPDVRIVGHATGATSELGEASIGKLINDGVKFNFILSINDRGAYGAVDAMTKAGFSCDSVSIVSVDAEALARQYIRDGCFFRGSAEASWTEPAHAIVDAMVQLLNGSTIAEIIGVPPGQVVTKDILEQEDATATASAVRPTPES